jgi:hypothetical protein
LITANPNISNRALAMNGDTKFPDRDTNWLLRTPAPVATNPLMRVARPIIVERSDCERVSDEEEDINHDSNAEKRIEVEMPPRTRPIRRIGRKGKRTQTQDRV